MLTSQTLIQPSDTEKTCDPNPCAITTSISSVLYQLALPSLLSMIHFNLFPQVRLKYVVRTWRSDIVWRQSIIYLSKVAEFPWKTLFILPSLNSFPSPFSWFSHFLHAALVLLGVLCWEGAGRRGALQSEILWLFSFPHNTLTPNSELITTGQSLITGFSNRSQRAELIYEGP